jgi:hypothetical protein
LKNYKEVAFDSSLSAEFVLSKSKDNESLIILGTAEHYLFIGITVQNLEDPNAKLKVNNSTIFVFILDQSSKQVIHSACVQKSKQIKLEKLENRLYEILVRLP